MDEFVYECGHKQTIKLYNHISQGKMLRSSLIIEIAGQSEKTIQLCAVIEMIHLASLLHDDVIDEAPLRRGKETIHKLYDTKTAIMLGDLLYSKAFSKLTLMDKDIAFCVSNAVTSLSIGEMLDIELSNSFNTNLETYIDMIEKKTASLIEASTKSASILANKNQTNFAIYGNSIGLCFQIIDDILDVTQDSSTLGKPCLLDFKEGKTTIVYILLYQNLSQTDKNRLKSYFKKDLNQDQQNWIKQMIHKHDIISKTKQICKNIAKDGLDAIKNEENKKLFDIINNIIDREK